jgi:putative flippase GtrA
MENWSILKSLFASKNLLRYLLVGSIAYIIEMGALFLLHDVFKYGAVKSAAISFWVGLCIAFLLQKFITFQNYSRRRAVLLKQLTAYSGLVVLNYSFTLLIVDFFSKSISVFILRTVAIIIITCWNFLIYGKIFNISS